jgi:hypothetical protein
VVGTVPDQVTSDVPELQGHALFSQSFLKQTIQTLKLSVHTLNLSETNHTNSETVYTHAQPKVGQTLTWETLLILRLIFALYINTIFSIKCLYCMCINIVITQRHGQRVTSS